MKISITINISYGKADLIHMKNNFLQFEKSSNGQVLLKVVQAMLYFPHLLCRNKMNDFMRHWELDSYPWKDSRSRKLGCVQWAVVKLLKMECHLEFFYYYSTCSMYNLLAHDFTDNYTEIIDLKKFSSQGNFSCNAHNRVLDRK